MHDFTLGISFLVISMDRPCMYSLQIASNCWAYDGVTKKTTDDVHRREIVDARKGRREKEGESRGRDGECDIKKE